MLEVRNDGTTYAVKALNRSSWHRSITRQRWSGGRGGGGCGSRRSGCGRGGNAQSAEPVLGVVSDRNAVAVVGTAVSYSGPKVDEELDGSVGLVDGDLVDGTAGADDKQIRFDLPGPELVGLKLAVVPMA